MCLETKTIKKEEELLQCIQRCIISPDLLRIISEGLFFSRSFIFCSIFMLRRLIRYAEEYFDYVHIHAYTYAAIYYLSIETLPYEGQKRCCFENCSSEPVRVLCGLQKNENKIPIHQHFYGKSAWAFLFKCITQARL